MNKKLNYTAVKLIITAVILIGVGIWLFYIFSSGAKEPVVNISDSSFKVTGMYGKTYNFSDITSITLESSLPKIEKRTNGYSLHGVLKGTFVLDSLGTCRLFLSNETEPFIFININNSYVIINFSDITKTQSTYQQLLDNWQNFSQN